MSRSYQMQKAEQEPEQVQAVAAAPSMPAMLGGGNALAAIASNAEVTQVLASIWIAKQFPRNLAQVTLSMQQACSRRHLAENATYTYQRGKTSVTGPSIRLAEALLGAWGNAEAGWQEVSRHFDAKKQVQVSECRAFCVDKETNLRREIAFSVPHWRDTQKGGYALKDERDVYELCANMAARRIRACILQVLPAWLTEEAMEIINKTLEGDGKKSLPDMIRAMEAKFLELGVDRGILEGYLEHPVSSCVVAELRNLRGIFNSVQNGEARVSDFFTVEKPADKKEAKAPMFAADPGDELPGLGGAGEVPSFGKEAYHD